MAVLTYVDGEGLSLLLLVRILLVRRTWRESKGKHKEAWHYLARLHRSFVVLFKSIGMLKYSIRLLLHYLKFRSIHSMPDSYLIQHSMPDLSRSNFVKIIGSASKLGLMRVEKESSNLTSLYSASCYCSHAGLINMAWCPTVIAHILCPACHQTFSESTACTIAAIRTNSAKCCKHSAFVSSLRGISRITGAYNTVVSIVKNASQKHSWYTMLESKRWNRGGECRWTLVILSQKQSSVTPQELRWEIVGLDINRFKVSNSRGTVGHRWTDWT